MVSRPILRGSEGKAMLLGIQSRVLKLSESQSPGLRSLLSAKVMKDAVFWAVGCQGLQQIQKLACCY